MNTKVPFVLFFLYVNLLFLSSCGVVETIFKAGMWWGIFVVVLVIGLIFFIISKLFGRR